MADIDPQVSASVEPPPSAAPPANPAYDANVKRKGITDLYQKYYWRDPTEDEITSHMANPDGLAGVEKMLAATPNQSKETKPTTDTSATTSGPSTTQPASPVTSTGKIAPPAAVPLAAPQLPTTPAPTYQPGQITQFQAPNQSGLSDPTSNLLKAIVTNPDTMNAGIVAQLKEKNKEEALQMQQQAIQQYGQGAVARGTVGAGDQTAFNQNTLMDTIGKVLSGNRGVDIQAASTNRADELAAANASDAFLTNELGRSTSAYGAGLAGQTAQADQNYKGYQSEAAAQQAAIQQALSQYGVNSDAARFNEATRQFNAGNSLDIQKFLESQRQFNDQLGFNYAGMDQQGNAGLMSLIQTIINGGR